MAVSISSSDAYSEVMFMWFSGFDYI